MYQKRFKMDQKPTLGHIYPEPQVFLAVLLVFHIWPLMKYTQ